MNFLMMDGRVNQRSGFQDAPHTYPLAYTQIYGALPCEGIITLCPWGTLARQPEKKEFA
jgi:hypothetical protein